MLDYEIRPASPASDDATLIILMHGRGANRFDLQGLGEYMPADANVVFPEAPFGGAQWGYGPGSAWYRFLGRNKPEPESFEHSLDELQKLIEHFSAPRVVLGGFSQGGTMSVAYALSHPGDVAGVINFSGFLADHPRIAATKESVADTAFFWGHGTQDASIPFTLAIEGRRLLRNAGARLEERDYDIGHAIAPEEVADAVRWLNRI